MREAESKPARIVVGGRLLMRWSAQRLVMIAIAGLLSPNPTSITVRAQEQQPRAQASSTPVTNENPEQKNAPSAQDNAAEATGPSAQEPDTKSPDDSN